MIQVETKGTDSYESYQSAIALYHEALRKWPSNRRAQNGDRKARLAYAELACKKGDVDLGLQVLPEDDDQTFTTVRSKLKRTRRVRGVIRATWGLATITTAALLVVSTLLYFRAENDKQKAEIAFEELERTNGTIQKLRSETETLTETAAEKSRSPNRRWRMLRKHRKTHARRPIRRRENLKKRLWSEPNWMQLLPV